MHIEEMIEQLEKSLQKIAKMPFGLEAQQQIALLSAECDSMIKKIKHIGHENRLQADYNAFCIERIKNIKKIAENHIVDYRDFEEDL